MAADDEEVSATQARQRAQEHLREDTARWGLIRPITDTLRAIRDHHRVDDNLSRELRQAWREPRI